MLLDKLGGRKFVLAILTLIIGTIVQIYSQQGVNAEFVSLLVGITAAFGASNAFVTSKAINAEASEPASEGATQDLTHILNNDVLLSNELADVKNEIARLSTSVSELDTKANLVAEGLTKVSEVAKAALTVSNRTKI